MMLSVLIESRGNDEALARTLAALVSAAIEGAVREVIVYQSELTNEARIVADAAGCLLLEGCVKDAITAARSDWLLLLEPGSLPLGDWPEAAFAHVRTGKAGKFATSRQTRGSLIARLMERRPLADGLLIEKKKAQSLAKAGDDAASIAAKARPVAFAAEIHRAK